MMVSLRWLFPSCLGCLGCLGVSPEAAEQERPPSERYVTIVTAEGRTTVVCFAGEEEEAKA